MTKVLSKLAPQSRPLNQNQIRGGECPPWLNCYQTVPQIIFSFDSLSSPLITTGTRRKHLEVLGKLKGTWVGYPPGLAAVP